MKIFATVHGEYEMCHTSLITLDLDYAIKHFLDYSKTSCLNCMTRLEIWENNQCLFDYGSHTYDIINQKSKFDLTYEIIKNDILKQYKID